MSAVQTRFGAVLIAVLLLSGCSGDSGDSAHEARSEGSAPSASVSTSPSTSPSTGPTKPPQSVACPRIGIYNGWNPDDDVDALEHFGALPQLASSYYQPDQDISVAAETARIRRGTSPNITITTKGTDYIEVLAAGPRHPQFDIVSAWLERRVDHLAQLAEVDRSVPVYVTLEHEFRVKARTGLVTGRSADPVVYGRALNRFYESVDAASRRLRTTYWIVGYDRAFEATVGDQFEVLPDVLVFDPYPKAASDSLTSIAGEDVDWLRAQPWYDGQEIGIGEFGMPVALGDRALARFYADLRQQLADLGVAWAVFFNGERDFDTRIVDRTDGQTFPLAQRAFARDLTDRRCRH